MLLFAQVLTDIEKVTFEASSWMVDFVPLEEVVHRLRLAVEDIMLSETGQIINQQVLRPFGCELGIKHPLMHHLVNPLVNPLISLLSHPLHQPTSVATVRLRARYYTPSNTYYQHIPNSPSNSPFNKPTNKPTNPLISPLIHPRMHQSHLLIRPSHPIIHLSIHILATH